MRDGYVDTDDVRNAIIEMIDDGRVLVGNINCNGHNLKPVRIVYHGNIGRENVLILETEDFVVPLHATEAEDDDTTG